jgi:hypothetical protein
MNADDLTAAVNVPKLFLIGRKALADSPERVIEALRLTPIQGVFVASELDALLADAICKNVMGLHQPFAIVADFPFEIASVNEGGRLVESKLPEVPEEAEPSRIVLKHLPPGAEV